jgi:hypothetical protein
MWVGKKPFKALRSIPLKPVIFLPKSSTKLRSSSHWIAFTATYRTTTSWCGTKISPSSTFPKPSMPKHIPEPFICFIETWIESINTFDDLALKPTRVNLPEPYGIDT